MNVPCPAQMTFEQAVHEYNSGRHARALSELKKYEASYPNNTLVHYYIALCEQALNHLPQAKAEYQWVVTNGDAKLRAQAAAGFAQLSNVRTSAYSSPSSSNLAIAQGSTSSARTKVRKVLVFDADY
jgi:tetratricopeptide (TPR) repeat protein